MAGPAAAPLVVAASAIAAGAAALYFTARVTGPSDNTTTSTASTTVNNDLQQSLASGLQTRQVSFRRQKTNLGGRSSLLLASPSTATSTATAAGPTDQSRVTEMAVHWAFS
ncbi:hypothetical protein HKX48_004996 [Thoreauomyces humboldtii]|nr:hypothetical protein HKX48_004996 [Thoreauomyces humboldtii]